MCVGEGLGYASIFETIYCFLFIAQSFSEGRDSFCYVFTSHEMFPFLGYSIPPPEIFDTLEK